MSERTRLKPGDKVIIIKPKNTKEAPGWFPSMDHFHGVVDTIVVVTSRFVQTRNSEGFCFNKKWLRKLE